MTVLISGGPLTINGRRCVKSRREPRTFELGDGSTYLATEAESYGYGKRCVKKNVWRMEEEGGRQSRKLMPEIAQ